MNGATRDWMPSTSAELVRLRGRVLRDIRGWFWERDVTEVDTPALSSGAATDPNITSFAVRNGDTLYYLQTSPEFPMKRLLAAGSGDIYQVCHVFREGEAGTRHNPEFTMLEWYRVGLDMHGMMDDVESLIGAICAGRRRVGRSVRITYRQLMTDVTGLDPFGADEAELAGALDVAGVDLPKGLEGDRDGLLDLVLAALVEPTLDPEQPVFVHDFPASQAALARVRPGTPPVAERFELFLGGMELANGFHELADPGEQQARFERDLARRCADGRTAPPMDRRFLDALRAGLPDCSGVALGLDRLMMFLAGADSIRDVLTFDISRA
jgi:lysyl-tRNA synthetase class 2